MKVLVACECSGRVRDAFIALGHDAMSCDLHPTETPGPHYQGSVWDVIDACWDLMIAHQPCTHLCVSGARHFEAKKLDGRQAVGASFFMRLAKCDIPKIAIENPVGIMSSLYRKPDQIIQPWQFGDEAQKTTCLWLKGLAKLVPSVIVGKGEFYVSPQGCKMPSWYGDAVGSDGKKLAYGSDEIKKLRSKTFPGIARAMADNWGGNGMFSVDKTIEAVPMELAL